MLARLAHSRLLSAVIVGAGLLVVGGVAGVADGTTIGGCENVYSGVIRLLPSSLPAPYNNSCNTTTTNKYLKEVAISWNQAGSQGPQGIQGLKGDTGLQGIQGLTGATGAQGLKGDTGAAGAPGAQGIQGPKGDKGDTGAQGAQGVKGDTGATGAQGPAGPAGTDGAVGPAGPPGSPGANGTNGVPGPQGPAGPQGPQGPAGASGSGGAAYQSPAFPAGGLAIGSSTVVTSLALPHGLWSLTAKADAFGGDSLDCFLIPHSPTLPFTTLDALDETVVAPLPQRTAVALIGLLDTSSLDIIGVDLVCSGTMSGFSSPILHHAKIVAQQASELHLG
jgi:collagen triple helix repeat protein